MPQTLEGIRVISMAEQYPGPYCTMLLADMGADVVLVERPGTGDPARGMGGGTSGFFAAVNRNKRSVAVNLKSEGGREALASLLRDADVFVEGFRPGVMARLGFDYARVRALNPRIVYCSISGYGQTGPYRDRPGHDLSYEALAGVLANLIPDGDFEHRPNVAMADLSSAMFATAGILGALLHRERHGAGQHVDVSMTDGMVSWMTIALSAALQTGQARGGVAGGEPAYGVFRCADGKWITLSVAHEDHFWRNLCGVLGRDDLATLSGHERRARRDELVRVLQDAMATRPRDAWVATLAAADVACGPLLAIDEVPDDPQVRARGMIGEAPGPDGGVLRYVAHPVKYSGAPTPFRRPAPALGEHTTDVLRAAGYDDAAIAALRSAGDIGQ